MRAAKALVQTHLSLRCPLKDVEEGPTGLDFCTCAICDQLPCPNIHSVVQYGLRTLTIHITIHIRYTFKIYACYQFEPPTPTPPPPPPVFKYPMKMKEFGLIETKLFHFHGIFNIFISPDLYTYEPPFQKSWIHP